MMLQDGVSKGNEPAVQVLEICQNLQRKPDDLLPYLSPFAEHYRPLPMNEKDYSLSWAFIPLNDIECFTKTVIDIPEAVRSLTKRKREYAPPPTMHILTCSCRTGQARARSVRPPLPVLEL